MPADLSSVNLALAAAVGGARGLCFIDPEVREKQTETCFQPLFNVSYEGKRENVPEALPF